MGESWLGWSLLLLPFPVWASLWLEEARPPLSNDMRKPFTGEADERRRWWVGAGASSAEEERAEEREVATVTFGYMGRLFM